MADPAKNGRSETGIRTKAIASSLDSCPPWREWAWLYLSSCLVTLVVELGYVLGLATGLHGFARVAFAMALVSQAAFLNLIPGLLTAWPLICWRHRPGARVLAGLCFALLQVALLADVAIYRLFQRHFDSLVWNILSTKGAFDSVRIDPASIVTAAAVVFIFIGCSIGFALWAAPRLVGRRLWFGLAIILIAVVTERTFFAAVDLRDNSTMQTVRDTLPLYQPLTIKHLAKKFGYKRPPGAIHLLPDGRAALFYNSGYYSREQLYLKVSNKEWFTR